MRRINWVFASVAVLATVVIVHAAEPTTKPSAAGGRLFAPYSKMASLTDEQRTKIREIHRKMLADIREIERKQSEEIAALLNDDQKKEMRELEAKEAAGKKTAKPDAAMSEGEK
jgi:hypothetical protein